MYGVPATLDLSFFRGKTLESVSCTEHQLQLRFSERVLLSIESTYRLDADNTVESFDDARDGASRVVSFISKVVTHAVRVDRKTLRIEFGPDGAFEAVDDSEQYESFQIVWGDDLTVV
jgi:hypothetical protein